VLARKHLGDPAIRFEIARRNFEEGMQYAESSRCKAASRRAYKAILVGDVVRLVTVLDKAGELDAAKHFQSKALKLINHKAIRNAIESTKRDRSKPETVC
jgi:hypothetical protein